jgi:hypothetical protein
MQALKEWAVACRALEEGKQIVILRKGGILEYRSGFEIKHDRFWLFPTFEHQSKENIKPPYWPLLDEVIKSAALRDGMMNVMTSFAKVVQVWEVENPEHLEALDDFHIWTKDYIKQRLDYNRRKPISVLLLRVFKSNEPLYVKTKEEWAGCKSWIPVEMESSSSFPVMDESQFSHLSSKVREVLSLAA